MAIYKNETTDRISGSTDLETIIAFGETPLADRLLRAAEPGFYRTGDTTKPFEHTLYIRLDQLWQAVAGKGLNRPPTFGTYNAFTEVAPAGVPSRPRPED